MNCADYTPVSGDVVYVKGWILVGATFAELNDSDGDGVWTGSSIAPGTWE